MRIKFIALLAMGLLAACSGGDDKAKPAAAAPGKPQLRLTLVPQEALQRSKKTAVLAKLTTLKEGRMITDDQLQVEHTQKFHLLVVDPTLTDYQHIHPQPTGTPGLYSFSFTPRMAGGYRAWADVTPAGGKQEFVMSEDLGAHKLGAVNRVESHEATMDNYHFTLSFDKPPVAGGESMGKINVTDQRGKPVSSLEPVMGAFAHIVGFYDDFRTVAHIHPMGNEPANAHDRGGPELSFHFAPTKAGFVKLFAQVNIGGKEMMVPFGVVIK